MDGLGWRLDASRRIKALARELANEARDIEGLDAPDTRQAIRCLYDASLILMNARAAIIARDNPPECKPGKPTNVGDPNEKGKGGKK